MKKLTLAICYMFIISLLIPLISVKAALPSPNPKSITLLTSYSSSMSDASIGQGYQRVLSNYPQLKLNLTLDAGAGNKISKIEFLRYGSPISTSIVANNAQSQTISTVIDGETKTVVSGTIDNLNTSGATYYSWYRYSNSPYWFADINGVQNSSNPSKCGPSLTCLGDPGSYDNINGTNFWKFPNVSSNELTMKAPRQIGYVLDDSSKTPISTEFVSDNPSNFSASSITDIGRRDIAGGFGETGIAGSIKGTSTTTMTSKNNYTVKFGKDFTEPANFNGTFSAPGAAWMDWFFAFKTTLYSKTFVYPDQIRVTYALIGGPSTPTPTPTATPIGATPAPTPTALPAATVISLTLDPTSVVIPIGGTSSFKATANYSDGSKADVTNVSDWSIANTTIANVSGGYVNGVKVGSTSVTAAFSGMSASGNVKVVAMPVAVLDVPAEVVTGDDFIASGTSSYSPNGAITKCIFMTNNANYNGTSAPPPGNYVTEPSCTGSFWYPLSLQNTTQKMIMIAVDVIGQGTYDNKFIRIVPPYIRASVAVGGTLKVNRKITIDPTISYSPSHYPINGAILSVVPITPGITAADIKYDPANVMDGQHKINILVKKPGQYSTTVNVTNSLGQNDTKTVTFTVVPDLPPIADYYWVFNTIYRDPVSNMNKAKIKLSDLSYSPDGDTIAMRKWYLYYDSNNDGNYTDEIAVILDSTHNKTYVEYDTANVGYYKVELEVTEGFGQPTIPEFITTTDYLKTNTWQ